MAGPEVAHADPAQPTDYRTVVVAVTPPTDAVEVDIVGGDSFVQLTADRGTEVVVEGYRGEPYLRFRGILTAWWSTTCAHRRPTSTPTATGGHRPRRRHRCRTPRNGSRSGAAGATRGTTTASHPDGPGRPPDAAPGDRIVEAVIPIEVDGTPVEVAVASDWLAEPSPLPLAVGAGLAALGLVALLVVRRRLAWLLLLAAVAALGIGRWQYSSLPPETGPRLVWWVLPAVAAGSVVLGLLLGRRQVSDALVALGAVELGVWFVLRRTGSGGRCSTDAPFWLDRGVMAAAAVAAVVVGLGALPVSMFRR